MANPTIYVDIDIEDSRASYHRAVEFVAANSIKYGLSTDVLADLGGREKLSIPELVSNDYAYSSKGRVQSQPQRGTALTKVSSLLQLVYSLRFTLFSLVSGPQSNTCENKLVTVFVLAPRLALFLAYFSPVYFIASLHKAHRRTSVESLSFDSISVE